MIRLISSAIFLMLAACASMNEPPPLSDIDRALLTEAKVQHAKQEHIKEAQIYAQLMKSNPHNIDFAFSYAEALRLSGNPNLAIQYYDLVLENRSDDADAMEGKALALMSKGNMSAANDIFQNVLKVDATRWRTINALGIISAVNKRVDAAMEYYDMALLIDPNNPNILNNIGLSYAFNGDYDNAVRSFDKALANTGAGDVQKRKKISLNLSLIYGIMGKTAEAEKILRANINDPAIVNRYLALYEELRSNRTMAGSYINNALVQGPALDLPVPPSANKGKRTKHKFKRR